MQTGAEFSAPCESFDPPLDAECTYNVCQLSGYTDAPAGTISPTSVSVSFLPSATSSNPEPLHLLKNGEPEPDIDEGRASEILKEEDLQVLVDLGHDGGASAKYWTCDFSHVSFLSQRHLSARMR